MTPTRYPTTDPTQGASTATTRDLGGANDGALGTDAPSSSITILIGQYQFIVRGTYAAGHVLNEAEAAAFNEWRARGIVGNMRERVNAAQRGLPRGELLSDATLAELQQQIDSFDSRYTHPMERGTRNTINPRPKRGAIEAMAWEIAGRALEAELRAAGASLHQNAFNYQREVLASSPECRAQARSALRGRWRAIMEELEE